MRALFSVAGLTLREVIRKKILWAALLLGAAFLLLYWLALADLRQTELSRPGISTKIVAKALGSFMLMAGLYVVNFLAVMMGVLVSVDTLSGEMASGTIHTLLSKPMHRRELVAGKWLAYSTLLTGYLLIMAGGTMAVTYGVTGYFSSQSLLGFLLLWLNSQLFLNLTLACSSAMSAVASGVTVLGLYGIAFVGGWIEQFAVLARKEGAARVAVAASLIMPGEAIWRRAAYEMRSMLTSSLNAVSPFVNSASAPSNLMMGYAVLYTAVALFLCFRVMSRRDL